MNGKPEAPLVSVVIPTTGRSSLLRAVASVQAQSHATLEILVVQDGPDERTRRELEALGDPRVRVLTQATPKGAAAARNLGIAAAEGTYIALLDDDDVFLPGKIAAKVERASVEPDDHFILVCAALVEGEGCEETWPRRFLHTDEAWASYLFAREWRAKRAFLQTSCLFAPRTLLLRLPMNETLQQHQDWDWLLEAEASAVRLITIDQPLTRYRMHNAAGSISGRTHWTASLGWAQGRRASFTPEAYAFFIAIQVMGKARAQEALSRAMVRTLLHEFRKVGRPTPLAWIFFALNFFQLGKHLRAMTRRSHQARRRGAGRKADARGLAPLTDARPGTMEVDAEALCQVDV